MPGKMPSGLLELFDLSFPHPHENSTTIISESPMLKLRVGKAGDTARARVHPRSV